MKLYKIIFILVVFFKTETLLSENNLFSVNNIQIEKKNKITNNALANQAIKKGFNQLIAKILLKEDIRKLSDLNNSTINQLVSYYRISEVQNDNDKKELVSFSITFDKFKTHDLFYRRNISYSEISDKELYILPILIRENEIFIFNNNYFYKNWNEVYKENLIEFILPLENIEVIKNINTMKNNLLDLEVRNLFKEYTNKNLALVIIEENKSKIEKAFIKAMIQDKNITKNLTFNFENLKTNFTYEKLITEIKKELIDLVKSKNLIDIRTPSFLNAKLELNKNSNLVKLNSRLQNIDLIENVYVQELNKDYMNLRIKYLGKLNKMINQLKKENIELQLFGETWVIKTL